MIVLWIEPKCNEPSLEPSKNSELRTRELDSTQSNF